MSMRTQREIATSNATYGNASYPKSGLDFDSNGQPTLQDASGNVVFAARYGTGAAAAANSLMMGSGTSAAPNVTSTADKFFIEFRCKTTATSGDNRLMYLRYEIGGAGGGECLRAFTALTAAAGTVRGCHFSLVPSGSGAVSGLGTATSHTLHFGTAAFSTGNVACIEANPYADSTGAPPSAHGAFRIAVGGNATGAAKWVNAFYVDSTNVSAADTTKMISTVSLAELPTNVGLAINIGGSRYYIPCVAAAGWN